METKKDATTVFYRFAYVMFILFAVYQISVSKDFIGAASSMGIALIFDPFNRKITWNDRPLWQRAWLIIHLAIVAALFGYAVALS